MVCTKAPYNYVDAGLLTIANIDSPLKVKRSTKTARIRHHKKNLGTSIDEYHNGLTRRFIPKGNRIDQYSIGAVANVQN